MGFIKHVYELHLSAVIAYSKFESLLDSLDNGILTVSMRGIRERPNTDSGYYFKSKKNGMYYLFVRTNFFAEPGDNYTPGPSTSKLKKGE